MDYPRITVVTPSFNQGRFIEETILSVVGQQYPNLEYIVIDGGSTDASVEVIKKYERHLAHWVSEPDRGQAHAINKGFAKATGRILAWLNSDDMYLPGALACAASALKADDGPGLLFGNCLHFVEGEEQAYGSDVRAAHETMNLTLADYIIQPSTFWTRSAWEAAGPLDESLNFGFDWEWFIRARKTGVAFVPADKYLSLYRIHGAHKTGTGGERRLQELATIYGRHAGAKYERLFVRCTAARSKIIAGRTLVGRLRLSRFEVAALKLRFPGLFRGFEPEEISDMITML